MTTGRPRATTHWAIRDTAIELFIADGYAATSLATIAKACGISRTTLFAYFPAKADIIAYGDERNFERLHAYLDDAPFDIPAGTVISGAARAMRPLPSNAREELTLYWQILDENPEVAARAAILGRRYSDALADFLAERLGTDDDDPVPALIGAAVLSVLGVASRHWTAHPECAATLDETLQQLLDPLLTAYLGER